MMNDNTLATIFLIWSIVLIVLCFLSDMTACERKAKLMGAEHHWGVFTRCMVKPHGHEGFIPLESYKFIDGVDGE